MNSGFAETSGSGGPALASLFLFDSFARFQSVFTALANLLILAGCKKCRQAPRIERRIDLGKQSRTVGTHNRFCSPRERDQRRRLSCPRTLVTVWAGLNQQWRSGFLGHRTLTELTVELRIVVRVVVCIIVLGVIDANLRATHREISEDDVV